MGLANARTGFFRSPVTFPSRADWYAQITRVVTPSITLSTLASVTQFSRSHNSRSREMEQINKSVLRLTNNNNNNKQRQKGKAAGLDVLRGTTPRKWNKFA